MGFRPKICVHLEELTEIKEAQESQCEECVKIGGTWVHLRTCQQCGTTLCCDSSPNTHARKHAIRNNHQVINSSEPGENWLYCFEHNTFTKYTPNKH